MRKSLSIIVLMGLIAMVLMVMMMNRFLAQVGGADALPGLREDLVARHGIVLEDEASDCCECQGGLHGCTPGFWKNHPDCWCEDYDPSDRVDSVFTIPSELSELADDSLMKALKYHGGSGVIGAARNLLRHGVSALLNACSDDVDYPMGVAGVINTVNAALATLDRDEIDAVKNVLAGYNELGCSIDAHCRPIEDHDLDGEEGEPGSVGEAAGEFRQGEKDAPEELPTRTAVSQSAPNPFRIAATIRFDLPTDSPVDLRVFNVSGRLVRVLVNEVAGLPRGRHAVRWDGLDERGQRTAPGVYFYRLRAGEFAATRRVVRLR